MQSNRLLTL